MSPSILSLCRVGLLPRLAAIVIAGACLGRGSARALEISLGDRLDDEVAVGDPEAKVISMLGEPKGRMRTGDKEILVYDRGVVTLRDKIVVETGLASADEAARQREERNRAAAARQAAAEEAKRLRIEKGQAEKERVLNDPEFRLKSAAQRLAYWQEFEKLFPGVSVATELQAAKKEIESAPATQPPVPGGTNALSQTDQIQALEKEIAELRAKRGQSRGGMMNTRREISRVQGELDTLKGGK